MLALLLISGKWIGLGGMIAAAIVGIAAPRTFAWETHYLLGMVFTLLFALAQVMTTYYFIGMRTAIVRASDRCSLDSDFASEAQTIKKRVTRLGHIMPLLATATLIVAGGVLGGKITPWLHWALGSVTIVLGVCSGLTEWRAFRDNASLFARAAAAIGVDTARQSDESVSV
jgi:hypothetical protein